MGALKTLNLYSFWIAAFFAFCFLLFASSASAQTIPVTIGGLELSVSTESPSPGQTVTITAASYATDLNTANISWTVGGKSAGKGIGLKTLDVKAPPSGQSLSVSISVAATDGRNYSSSVTIRSGSVDLIAESDGYTPPSFLGKVQPSYQNNVKVIAIPHISNSSGVEYDPKTLVYQWKKSDNVLQDQSGYGKQTVVIPGDLIPRPYTISISVSTRDGTNHAESIMTVSPGPQSLAFYIDDPLYGILYNKAVSGSVNLGAQKESGIKAVPFGFNRDASGGGSTLLWRLNGVERPELSASDSIVLRAPEGSSGSSDIQLDVTSPASILQRAVGGLRVLFSAKPSGTAAAAPSF